MRGKLDNSFIFSKNDRITPAGAGKTRCTAYNHAAAKDHPRRCGENIVTDIYDGCKSGSPPQVRGKPLTVINKKSEIRITPAGAGKTLSYSIL